MILQQQQQQQQQQRLIDDLRDIIHPFSRHQLDGTGGTQKNPEKS